MSGLVRGMFERRMTLQELDQLMDLAAAPRSSAGVDVTAQSSLTVMAVYDAVRTLAETLASLPLILYRRLAGGGKERATDHWLYPILHDRANPEITSMEWRMASQAHLALRGNAYSEIEWDRGARVRALWPIHPDRVRVRRDLATRELAYGIRVGPGADLVTLPASRVLHVRGLSGNGLVGYNPIELAREALGLSIATQEFGARLFQNGIRPSGVLQSEKRLSDPAYKRMKAQINEEHGGLTNMQRMMLLEEGLKWQQTGINPDDAQFLESRKFQVVEIARMFNIPPHRLKDLDRATNNNIEHQSLEFVVYTMRPIFVNWEQRLAMSLLPPADRATHFMEFLIEGLLRGDWKSRSEALHIMRQDGIINADEWRAIENMNPQPDGRGAAYWQPVNMQEAGLAPPDMDERLAAQRRDEMRLDLAARRVDALEALAAAPPVPPSLAVTVEPADLRVSPQAEIHLTTVLPKNGRKVHKVERDPVSGLITTISAETVEA